MRGSWIAASLAGSAAVRTPAWSVLPPLPQLHLLPRMGPASRPGPPSREPGRPQPGHAQPGRGHPGQDRPPGPPDRNPTRSGAPSSAPQRPGSGPTTRVALVEDHAVLAEALRMSLTAAGFDVVGIPVVAGESTAALVASVANAQADVVLLDLHLGPAGDGGRMIEPLSRMGQRVVVLTGSTDPVRWGECLARGALTVLSKSGQLQPVVDVILRVAQGLPVMPPARRDELVQLWIARKSDAAGRLERLAWLTPREAEVLLELVRGKRVREVARDAFVSEATVRTQVKSILAKLGVSSQLAAVALARDAGWGAPPGAGE